MKYKLNSPFENPFTDDILNLKTGYFYADSCMEAIKNNKEFDDWLESFSDQELARLASPKKEPDDRFEDYLVLAMYILTYTCPKEKGFTTAQITSLIDQLKCAASMCLGRRYGLLKMDYIAKNWKIGIRKSKQPIDYYPISEKALKVIEKAKLEHKGGNIYIFEVITDLIKCANAMAKEIKSK